LRRNRTDNSDSSAGTETPGRTGLPTSAADDRGLADITPLEQFIVNQWCGRQKTGTAHLETELASVCRDLWPVRRTSRLLSDICSRMKRLVEAGRFWNAKHEVQVLDRCARRAFAKVIKKCNEPRLSDLI
jgi:hypothetical protein